MRALKPELVLKVQAIDPVPTSAFPTPAQHPHNCTQKLQQTFGLTMLPWQQGVDRMLADVL